jgi:hypothetical protein
MQEQIVERLKELTAEFGIGQNRLVELEGQAKTLRHNLLRVIGAIQVLEEIAKDQAETSPPDSEDNDKCVG